MRSTIYKYGYARVDVAKVVGKVGKVGEVGKVVKDHQRVHHTRWWAVGFFPVSRVGSGVLTLLLSPGEFVRPQNRTNQLLRA